jgi:hypothetical protein
MIRFDLSITLDYAVQSSTDFVFVVQPTNTPYQRVTWESLAVEPELHLESEVNGSPGNRHIRVHAEPVPFACAMTRSWISSTTLRCPTTCTKSRSPSCPPR